MKLLARLLIAFSILCYSLGIYYTWLQNDPNRLAFSNYHSEQHVSANKKEQPVKIEIKSLKINVPLIPARLTGKTWEVTGDGASYLTSSPIPGEKGNSIIYAHNWASLFGNLVNAKKGDEIVIHFADKSVKKFTVTATTIVSPEDNSILKQTNDNRITLYTCTAFLDSKRFVVSAVLNSN